MRLLLLSLQALLITVSCSAAPRRPYTCHPFTLPIPVNNVTTIVPPFPPIENAYQATYYANLFTKRGAPTPQVNFTTLTKTFNISGQVCTPNRANANTSTLHIATHGLGFNQSYWDFYLPSNKSDTQYSYISAATSYGYTVLTYNRLGIFPSAIADPDTEVQATVEAALLIALTTVARQGKVPGLPKPPAKIIHVGHSFGSQLSLALAALAPSLSDGLVLTGFSDTTAFAGNFLASTSFHLISQNQPSRFGNRTYAGGYLTWGDAQANQYAFLAYPNFDPSVLQYAESAKYPFTLGELLSMGALPTKALKFAGPVLFVLGSEDVIFCGGNCTGVVGVGSAAVGVLGNSTGGDSGSSGGRGDVKIEVVEGFGHGVNLHRGVAEKAYGPILKWVGEKL